MWWAMPLPHDRKRRGRGALQAMTLSFLGVFLYITIIRPLYNEPAVSVSPNDLLAASEVLHHHC